MLTRTIIGLVPKLIGSIEGFGFELDAAGGAERVTRSPMNTGAEDFSYFQRRAPGIFVFLGVTPRDQDATKAAPNHSPKFFVNEDALPTGVKTYVALAMDYLKGAAGRIP